MKPGIVYTCFSTDFLIEEADSWQTTNLLTSGISKRKNDYLLTSCDLKEKRRSLSKLRTVFLPMIEQYLQNLVP